MSEKQRTLPPWMAKKEIKVKAKTPLKTQRKRKAARAVFYCMNEAELVEAAVSYLTDCSCEDAMSPVHQQVEKEARDASATKAKPCISSMTAKPLAETLEEESSDRSADLEASYVSETDLDITEVETLPYTRSPQRPESEKRSEAPQDDRGLINTDTEVPKETRQTVEEATEEDDPIRSAEWWFPEDEDTPARSSSERTREAQRSNRSETSGSSWKNQPDS